MNTLNPQFPLPSRSRLIRATLIAVITAGVILVTTVLPAEYAIDPTGIGKKLGLLGMSAGDQAESETAAVAPPAATLPAEAADGSFVRNDYVVQSATPLRSGEMRVTLAANKGAEIKARMRKGEQFVFGWNSDGGVVEFDMHGEEVNAAKDVFTSYWQADASTASGTFTAPFDGSHGWYWHNNGSEPVTVTVTVSGFYSELYRP